MLIAKTDRVWKGIVEGICYLFVLLFVYAAMSKVLDFETFRLQLGQSPVLSAYAGFIAWAVPAVELGLAILLMVPFTQRFGLFGCFLLMVMFTAYIYIILNFSDFVPCSCGGVLEDLSWTQHLFFNIGFILLAGLALIWEREITHWWRRLIPLSAAAILGIGIMAVLFGLSERKMHRNNAFQRRHLPHPIDKIAEYDLGYNSFYLAGFQNKTIYLGNYKAPLNLRKIAISTGTTTDLSVSVSDMGLPYKSVRIVVDSSSFYVGDGTVPILFKGSISDWKAKPIYDGAYFNQFVTTGPAAFGIVTLSSETRTQAVGLVQNHNLKMAQTLLSGVDESLFASDGMLLWNNEEQHFIYVYYYKNEYRVINRDLTLLTIGKTIDTIGSPVLDVRDYRSKRQLKLGANAITVNRNAEVFRNYLFVESERLGKFEEKEILETASIVDVYNYGMPQYLFSFYLYHDVRGKLSGFRIDKNLLAAVVDTKLIIYRLKPEFFNTGDNPTYTGQYQE